MKTQQSFLKRMSQLAALKASHQGNALILTISILFLATAQLLFMGLVTSSTATDEALLVGQNAEVKDALNLAFIDLENRINAVRNYSSSDPLTYTFPGALAPNNTTNATRLFANFGDGGACMPSYRRSTTDDNYTTNVLASTAVACPYQIAGNVPFNTLLRSRLGIEVVDPAAPTTRRVMPPLDQYKQIDVYISRMPAGKLFLLEARATGRCMNLTIQKQLLLD